MNADEWQKSTDPQAMLSGLGRNPSKRKRRLFGCACCRRIWPLAADERSRAAVVAAEQFADGRITGAALERAERAAKAAARADGPVSQRQAAAACETAAEPRAGIALGAWMHAVWAAQWSRVEPAGVRYYHPDLKPVFAAAEEEESAHQAALLLDFFGNPFRPVSFSPSWRTSTALSLAQGIYEDRAWDRMPILADALQDAGAEGDLLDHLRGPGPHVLGCHVLDAVLGRE